MIDLTAMLRPGSPAWRLATASPDEVEAAAAALARTDASVVVRRIRGSRARTPEDLFDEMAAAMQFPSSFGGNWNALADMLADLSWLPGRAYVLVIDEADALLADAPEEVRAAGLGVLSKAAAYADSTGVPFRFLARAEADGPIARALRATTAPVAALM
jgi:Barstar (barnase inhibitor)